MYEKIMRGLLVAEIMEMAQKLTGAADSDYRKKLENLSHPELIKEAELACEAFMLRWVNDAHRESQKGNASKNGNLPPHLS